MTDIIAQRFVSLRKHLSERVGMRLTMEQLAEKAGIPSYKMEGLEHDKGTWSSHLTLLLYFRSQGYNLDWILFEDNSKEPMMLPTNEQLYQISNKIKEIAERYQQDYQEVLVLMKNIGYNMTSQQATHSAVTPTGSKPSGPDGFVL